MLLYVQKKKKKKARHSAVQSGRQEERRGSWVCAWVLWYSMSSLLYLLLPASRGNRCCGNTEGKKGWAGYGGRVARKTEQLHLGRGAGFKETRSPLG